MSLRSLYKNISEYSDFALIGRDFSAFDTDYSVLGFANSSDKTELVLLNFNCSKDDICCEDLTLRENIILEKKNNSDLSDDFSAIVIDGINKVIYHLRVYETRLEERQAFRRSS